MGFMLRIFYTAYNETSMKGTIMYVGPKKFVESDFVTRMRLKYSTTSEDGTVELTPEFKIYCNIFGVAVSAAITSTLYVVSRRILDKTNSDTPIED
jgi:hypothetical protein